MPDLTVAEILKKVRGIQILANRTANDLFAGHYRSVFRGQGMEFEEVRQYQPGDDIRSIDWNVTARSQECFIKRFREERELTVLFLVDVSASGAFGSAGQARLERATEVAALLMFSALKNNDKVGLATFCDQVVNYLPPRKGKSHVLRSIRQLVGAKPVARETCLESVLVFLNRVQKRRAVVFLISDFLATIPDRPLMSAGRRHDLTAIRVADRRERELPNVGFVRMRDAETGAVIEIDTSSRAFRRRFKERNEAREDQLATRLRRAGVDQLVMDTHSDYAESLRRFFHIRELRFR